ncbi:dipeptidyl peptidase iv (dpp iv) n-terminal region domain-containing protein [Cystoisospora suis]|uniref:Dipeptidyl peptidase iv (Dpp iv) n-terminal region domain-containing protein n=1 Tax=Cystoisospora suis TaxID=483139 RepID=A0A2C6KDZ0_9APIC|nr:dipeptidyl peptidase iv (dpp iv) n-terminal region domain-containing protein [Cystoisospora suis]
MDAKETDAFWSFASDGGCSSAIDGIAFGSDLSDPYFSEQSDNGTSTVYPSHRERSSFVWLTWLDCAERGFKRLYGSPILLPGASSIPSPSTSSLASGQTSTPSVVSQRSMRLPVDLQDKLRSPVFPMPADYTQGEVPPVHACLGMVSSLPASSRAYPRFEPASSDRFYFNNGGCLLVHPDDLHPESAALCRQTELTQAATAGQEAQQHGAETFERERNQEPDGDQEPRADVPRNAAGVTSCKSAAAEATGGEEAHLSDESAECSDKGQLPTKCDENNLSANGSSSGTSSSISSADSKGTTVCQARPIQPRQSKLSLEEELMNERQRRRCLGVTRYSWSERGKMVLLSNPSGVWVYDDFTKIESVVRQQHQPDEPAAIPCRRSSSTSQSAGTDLGASKDSEEGQKSRPIQTQGSSVGGTPQFLATNALTPETFLRSKTEFLGSDEAGGQRSSHVGKRKAQNDSGGGAPSNTPEEMSTGPDCGVVSSVALSGERDLVMNETSSSTKKTGEASSFIHPSGRSFAFGKVKLVLPRKKEGGKSLLDCSFSPDASRVAFVHGQDIHVMALKRKNALDKTTRAARQSATSNLLRLHDDAGKKASATGEDGGVTATERLNDGVCMLTTSGREGKVINGLAEYVAQEEMFRTTGYWWSPCGNFIAFCQFEEGHIPPLCLQRVRIPQYNYAQTSECPSVDSRGMEPADTENSDGSAKRNEAGEQSVAQERTPTDEETGDEEWSDDEGRERRLADENTELQGGGPEGGVKGSEALRQLNQKTQKSATHARGPFIETEGILIEEKHHFPFAGLQNVRIRVGVVQVPSATEICRAAEEAAASGSIVKKQVPVASLSSSSSSDSDLHGACCGHSPTAASFAAGSEPFSLNGPLVACARCSTPCHCPLKSGSGIPSSSSSSVSEPVSKNNASVTTFSSLTPFRIGAKERFISLPVDDWKGDFYVARVQWMCLQRWEDVVLLKLLTNDEVRVAKAGLRRPKNTTGGETQLSIGEAATLDSSKDPSPPPILLLQLQNRLQQEIRICAALPWLPSDFQRSGSQGKNEQDLESEQEKECELREEKLRCVVCFTERSQYWINLHDDLHQVGKSLWYTWTAERKVCNELYLQNLSLPGLSFRVSSCSSSASGSSPVRLLSVLSPPTSPSFSSSGHRYVIFAANHLEDSPTSRHVCITRLPPDSELADLQKDCHDMRGAGKGEVEVGQRQQARKSNDPREHKQGRIKGKFWGQKGKWRIEIRDLEEPWAFLTNPFVEGHHSMTICDKHPLVVHQHHSRVSPRQLWIRYYPDWDSTLGHKHEPDSPERPHFYSLLAAAHRGREIYDRQLALPNASSSPAEIEHTIKRKKTEHQGAKRRPQQERKNERGVIAEEETKREGNEDDEHGTDATSAFVDLGGDPRFPLLRDTEHLVYVYEDSAAGGQVLHEFQQVQRLYLRVARLLVTPTPFDFIHGGVRLFGCYYRPRVSVHGPGPYRAVVSLYGGPTVQFVVDSLDLLMDMRAQTLARLGLIVVKVDNRGSFGRTVAFEKASIYKRLGAVELLDQRAAVMYLHEAGLVALSEQETVPYCRLSYLEPNRLHNSLGSVETNRSQARTKKRAREGCPSQGEARDSNGSNNSDCENGSEYCPGGSLHEENRRPNGDGRSRAGRGGDTTLFQKGVETVARQNGEKNSTKLTPSSGEDGYEDNLSRREDEDEGEQPVVGTDGLVSTGVGIYGISYGGYLAAMAHFTHPDVFTCCWSAAPVTAWELYSTHYTERFLLLPHLNPAGYQESSVLRHVHFLEPTKHRLKLLHGYLDENVHMQHSLVLLDKMIQHQLPADFVCLPQSRHGPNIPSERRFFARKLFLFFAEHLLLPEKRPQWPLKHTRSVPSSVHPAQARVARDGTGPPCSSRLDSALRQESGASNVTAKSAVKEAHLGVVKC